MKKYTITRCDDSGIYLRGDTYYECISLRNSKCEEDISVVKNATLKITIIDPCDNNVVNEQIMTESSIVDGTYTYCYSIPSDALYGEFTVNIELSSPSDCIAKYTDNFFILPFDLTSQIRRLLGTDAKKIDDHELTEEAWYAYVEVRDKVLSYHYREKLCCCIDGTCYCSQNNIECDTKCGCGSPINCDSYRLKYYPIADFNNDDSILGCKIDTEDCQDDICCIWIDSDGECQSGSVQVINAECGEIKVYQEDGKTLIPTNNKGIYIDYYSSCDTFTIPKFKKTIAYLAAFEIAVKYNMVSKIAAGCDERSKISFAEMLKSRYIECLESISNPVIGSVK